MADCILMQAGGGGLDPDELTATAGDVLKGMLAGVKGYDDPVRGTLELTGTAADSQVLNGQTYYNTDAKTKRTGGMPNRGAWTGRIGINGKMAIPAGYHNGAGYVDQAINNRGAWNSRIGINGKVAIPEGYHNGSGYVDQAVTNRGAWTGSVAMNGNVVIPEGYHNGQGKVTGPSITNRGNYGGFGNSKGNDAGNQRMWVRIPGGYYNENANVYLSWADIRNLAGLTADKLKKGVSVMGLAGTYEGYSTSPLYLYNSGVWGGGQSGVTFIGGGGDKDLVKPNFIQTFDGKARLNNSVDFTPYKYVKIVVTNAATPNAAWTSNAAIEVRNGPNATDTLIKSIKSGRMGIPATVVLDVSGVNGFYWLSVTAGSGSSPGGIINRYDPMSISQIMLTAV